MKMRLSLAALFKVDLISLIFNYLTDTGIA